MTSVPTISITTPDLESKDYMPSGTVTPTTPDSPTVFDVVKELENKEPFMEQEDEALDLTEPETSTKQIRRSAIDNDVEDQEQHQPKTIKSFYSQKCILITGATGFIGKAVLWKLIQSLGGSVDKIFILLRQSRQHQRSAKDRLQDDILSNKVEYILLEGVFLRVLFTFYCDFRRLLVFVDQWVQLYLISLLKRKSTQFLVI
jgi:FlaA1/EpsC-like NDP-sugar epimerase